MFWRRKPTETERLTEEAVAFAAERLETIQLHGSDFVGWGDSKEIGGSNIRFKPSRVQPQLYLRGTYYNLTRAQAERLHNAIRRRALRQAAAAKETEQ